MNNQKFSLLPGLIWKIEGVVLNQYGKVKGPVISILDGRWKLNFYYLDTKDGAKFSIILKKLDSVNNFSNLQFTTYFYKTSSPTVMEFNYSHYITDTMKECLIWESKVSDIARRYTFEFFNKNLIFCFHSGGCVLKNEEKHANAETDSTFVPYSPCTESLCQNIGNLYNNMQLCDVILECGDKKIYAHRTILAARSEVFLAMFRNDMSESKQRIVTIRDIEPLILEKMVRYLYSGNAGDIDIEIAPKLFAAADKYNVDGLKIKCGTIMVDKKQPDSGRAAAVAVPNAGVDGTVSISQHFNHISNLLKTAEWKKMAEKEPKFAYKAFQYFVRESTA